MSLLESGESDGSVSLNKLMDGESCRPQSPGVQTPEMVDLVCRGGWPRIVSGTPVSAQRYLRGYLDDISRTDIAQVDDVIRQLRDRVDTNRMGDPVKLAVITATGVGVELPDGIAVIPATTLGP